MILAFAIVFLIKVPVGANEVPTGTSLLIKEYYDELSRRDNCSYIYYDLQGGLNSMNNPEAIYNNRRITLVEPYKFGYAFAGWFIDSNYRYKVTSLRYKEGQSYVLHAKWNRKVDNINSVLGLDIAKSILFSKGINITKDNIGKECNYDFIQALTIDKNVLKDSYVKNKLYGMIEKRIREAKKGVIQVDGCYAIICGDLYALCQSMFGLEVTGLLGKGEFYSDTWSSKGINEIKYL